MTEAEREICKIYLGDLDKRHSCNEYKMLMGILDAEPCKDTISRQEAIDVLRICDNNEDGINCHKCPLRDDRWDGAWQDEDGTTCYRQLMRDSAELLSAQPERKKGKWIQNDNGTYSCSLCHSWIPEEQYYYAQFCLYCGADMRGLTIGKVD